MYFTLTFTCTILLCKVVLVKDEHSTLITVTTDNKGQTSSFSLPAQFVVAMKCTQSNADGPICRKKQVLLYLCSLLLTLSYAPEPKPGPRPIKFPCAVCNKAVKWSTPGVCCVSCEVWFHQKCMGMPDVVYNGLRNISWYCCQCGLPNISPSIFDSTFYESSNSFTILSDTMHSDISFSNPAATSSPTKSTQQQLQPQKRKDLPMRIVVVNCQSIKSDGKPSQLRNLVSSIQADIVIGTESWLNPTIRDAEVFPEGFKAYRRDRTDGKGGGVFLLISKKYDSSEPEELKVSPQDDIELVWVKIKTLGSNDLYIGSFYKPPGRGDPQYLDKLYSFITRIPTANGAHLWIGGDFNLGDINWEKETVNEYATNGTQCNQLLTITKDTFLDQVVQEPTRVTETTANVLDLFFTKNSTLTNKVEVIPGISDHEAVFIESSLRLLKVKVPPRKVLCTRT